MPLLGIGTYLSSAGEVGQAVKAALAVGYRHIDCAKAYENEHEIGKALQEVFAEGKIKRSDIFITSKLPSMELEPSGIESKLDKTLSDLRTTYLDLYLVHVPVPAHKVDGKPQPLRKGWGLQDIWRAMEALVATKKVKAIGVSNYPTVVLNDMLCYAKIPPAVNQIERHPYLTHKKHVEFCWKNNVHITAFASLGALGLTDRKDAPNLLTAEPVVALAKKHNKTPAQILIRWSIDTNVVAIPKSVKLERIKENFSVWDFKLSHEEVESLNAMDKGLRFYQQDWQTVPMFT